MGPNARVAEAGKGGPISKAFFAVSVLLEVFKKGEILLGNEGFCFVFGALAVFVVVVFAVGVFSAVVCVMFLVISAAVVIFIIFAVVIFVVFTVIFIVIVIDTAAVIFAAVVLDIFSVVIVIAAAIIAVVIAVSFPSREASRRPGTAIVESWRNNQRRTRVFPLLQRSYRMTSRPHCNNYDCQRTTPAFCPSWCLKGEVVALGIKCLRVML